MRRDRELQIKMLRQVRDRIDDPAIMEAPEELRAYNAGLLIDEGLVEGRKVKGNQGQCVGSALISLTPAGHDFLEAIDRAAEAPISIQPTVPSMTIFISHSSQDAELAGKLAKLFQLSFSLPPAEIRCTSVDGYRLPVGTDTDQRLRREVKESRLFLAVITPTSIRSSYVLFELGGRWCTELPMFPVLGRGATSSCLEGPLAGINALDLQRRREVLQLVEDMARELGVGMASMSSIDAEVDAVWEAAKTVADASQSRSTIEVTANDLLDADDKRILHYIHEAHPEHPDEKELVEKLGIRLREVEYSIRKLAKLRFISPPSLTKELWREGQPNPDGYCVLDRGFDYIRANMTKPG
jgi:hypothetical protein